MDESPNDGTSASRNQKMRARNRYHARCSRNRQKLYEERLQRTEEELLPENALFERINHQLWEQVCQERVMPTEHTQSIQLLQAEHDNLTNELRELIEQWHQRQSSVEQFDMSQSSASSTRPVPPHFPTCQLMFQEPTTDRRTYAPQVAHTFNPQHASGLAGGSFSGLLGPVGSDPAMMRVSPRVRWPHT